MKRIMLMGGMLFLLISGLNANQIIGAAGDRLVGSAPTDTLIININVTVIVPARIGLYVDADLTFDLSAPVGPSTTYPPATFPGYYYPTSASATNPEGVVVQVFSNSTSYTWHLEIYGAGDFTSTITLNQLFVAPDGEPAPSEGTDPPGGNWTPLSTAPTELNNGTKTSGWADYSKDFVFQAQADDEPTSGATQTISFRLWAQ